MNVETAPHPLEIEEMREKLAVAEARAESYRWTVDDLSRRLNDAEAEIERLRETLSSNS